jgi:hypothetical protein
MNRTLDDATAGSLSLLSHDGNQIMGERPRDVAPDRAP